MYLDKQTFMQQYVLTRISHKKKLKDLLVEADHAWTVIDQRIPLADIMD